MIFFSEIDVVHKDIITFSDRGETFYINTFQFNTSFLIFGLNVSLTVFPKPGSGLSPEEVACAVVFLTPHFQSVMASNPVRYKSFHVNYMHSNKENTSFHDIK